MWNQSVKTLIGPAIVILISTHNILYAVTTSGHHQSGVNLNNPLSILEAKANYHHPNPYKNMINYAPFDINVMYHHLDSLNKLNYVPDEIIVKFKQTTADKTAEELNKKTAVKSLRVSDSIDKLNRKYELQGIKPLFKNFKNQQEKIRKLLSKNKNQLTRDEKRILARLKRAPKDAKVPALDRIYKLNIKLKAGQSLKDAVVEYNSSPDVEYAQLNHRNVLYQIPNDTHFAEMWSLNNNGGSYPTPGGGSGSGTEDCDIDAPEAWNISTGNSNIVVAVIDTGVDYNHRDLQNNIWTNTDEIPGNGIDDDNNGYIDDVMGYDISDGDNDPADYFGHGTHCSGTIAAVGNNNTDVTGICWNAKIMPVKYFPDATDEKGFECIHYAVDNGADVLSNSWGPNGPQPSNPTIENVIDYAVSQGCIVVFSAGNDNDNVENYSPANYAPVISVAATDWDDKRASFSNFGDLVDIAAPGVDILSLRASSSTEQGYTDYTIIMSGTSMACPHVAGACALLLSNNNALSVNDVWFLLTQNTDPIDSEVCASGRLNVYNALSTLGGKGFIKLNNSYYSCSDQISIELGDTDANNQQGQEVFVESSSGDEEILILARDTNFIGLFTGTISTSGGTVDVNDGVLQISHNDTITITYEDANDGSGNPATVIKTATADCQAPVISNLQIDASTSTPVVTFETDEPAVCELSCGTNCNDPNLVVIDEVKPSVEHTLKIKHLSPSTQYFYVVKAADHVENIVTDDNDGECYTFTTIPDMGDINVPADYNTIQAAIDHSWDGDTIYVADGIYSGAGNTELSYDGKAITVKSINGPDNCIIECSFNSRGFAFYSGEDANSVLDGLTIRHGAAIVNHSSYYPDELTLGGGIYCLNTNPTIKNCKIIQCTAGYWGGGLFVLTNKNMTIQNCLFQKNAALHGGAIYREQGSECTLALENCDITENICDAGGGGGIYSYGGTDIVNCVVADNVSTGFYFTETLPLSSAGGGIIGVGNINISNSIIKGNLAWTSGGLLIGGGVSSIRNCVMSKNMSFIGEAIQISNGTSSISNSTFVDNISHSDRNYDGIWFGFGDNGVITNCILNNGSHELGAYEFGSLTLRNNNIVGGESEISIDGMFSLTNNIDTDPCFAFEDDYHLMGNSPCINHGLNDFNDANIPSADLDGNPRPLDGCVDIGVYEFNSEKPSIALSTKVLRLHCQPGSDTNASLSIRNCGGGTLSWQANEQCEWLSVNPSSGNSSGEVNTVDIIADSDGLGEGKYIYELGITANNAANNPRKVTIILDVGNVLRVPDDYSFIQEAINAAVDGDIVLVADGTYCGGGNRDLRFFGKAITVKSENGPENCIIDCGGSESESHRGFSFFIGGEEANSIIDGFTITNGYANDNIFDPIYPLALFGGGIFCDSVAPIIKNCIIKNNYAAWDGGGIFNANDDGWSVGAPTADIIGCVITENSCGNGPYGGGGMFTEGENTIANCIISNNRSPVSGGGAIIHGDNPTKISNCTIVGNSANVNGGGLEIECKIILNNCIVWNNNANDGNEVSIPSGKVDIAYCDIKGGSEDIYLASGAKMIWGCNIDADPMFAGADVNNFHLSLGSPCINTGNPHGSYEGQTDIDGDARVIGSVDIGADEAVGVTTSGAVYNVTKKKTYPTINAAIDDANNGDEIMVYEGIYYETVNFDGKAITLTGTFPDNWNIVESTIIDANGSGFTVTFNHHENSNSSLKGFMIQGSYYDGVTCSNSAPTIERCILGNNLRRAVHCAGNSAASNICNNIIRDNAIGIWCRRGASPVIKNNLIYNNYQGINTFVAGAVVIRNNTIVNNTCHGIYKMAGTIPIISNCIIWDCNDDLSGCSAKYSCIEDTFDINDPNYVGSINSDPCFADANYFHLLRNSPCVGAGDPSGNYIGEVDIDGDERILEERVDIGSDEWARTPPVAYWKFDEGSGTIVNDSVGDNNGTVYGATWITGRVNGALSFDGSDDYVGVPNNDNSLDMDNQMTISAWVKMNNFSNYYFIVTKQPSYPPSQFSNYPGNYEFRVSPSGYLELLHETGTIGLDITFATYTSTSTVTPGVWQHVVVTLEEGVAVKFYINGEPAGTSSQTETFGIANSEPVRIGTRKDGYSYFNGAIDDVRIYNSALPETDIQWLSQQD